MEASWWVSRTYRQPWSEGKRAGAAIGGTTAKMWAAKLFSLRRSRMCMGWCLSSTRSKSCQSLSSSIDLWCPSSLSRSCSLECLNKTKFRIWKWDWEGTLRWLCPQIKWAPRSRKRMWWWWSLTLCSISRTAQKMLSSRRWPPLSMSTRTTKKVSQNLQI